MLVIPLLLLSLCCNGPVISTSFDVVRPHRRDRNASGLQDAFYPQDVHLAAGGSTAQELHILPSRAGLMDTVLGMSTGTGTSAHSGNGSSPALDADETSPKCSAGGNVHGVCCPRESCRLRSGRPAAGGADAPNSCSAGQVCCVFEYTCGDAATERSLVFRSPGYPEPLAGTLACDFDLLIRHDSCVVRVDFEVMELSRRLGGVCDLDQLVILNSSDGPIAPLCGPMSNFSTFVAVQPSQIRPLKLAVLVQGSKPILWQLRLTQLSCNASPQFKAPKNCGLSSRPASDSVVSFEDINELKRRHDVDRNRLHNHRMRRRRSEYTTLLPRVAGNSVAEDRIIGGEDARPAEFPWQVAILLEKLFFCGGTIVSESVVLTAAHCIITRDTTVAELRVVGGAVDMAAALEGTVPHQERSVAQAVFHSHFHPFLLDNDIAILRLRTPFIFSAFIGPVCLPHPDDMYANRAGWVAGWGVSSFGGEPSALLQRLRVVTMSTSDCSKVVDEPLGAGMLCAAPLGREGTCFGDSGGPLIVDSPDGRSTFVGIVSFGVTGCAAIPAFPDVYTRVSAYLHWIDVTTKS